MQHISHDQGVFRRAGGIAPTGLELKVLPVAVALCFCPALWAGINDTQAGLPMGGTVAAGTVSSDVTSSKLTLTQTGSRAVIDWQSFNINAGNTVQFVQPSATSAALNRVPAGAGLSQIYGTLSANGMVLLMNPNGVLFGAGSSINVASLIATTGTVDEAGFMSGGAIAISGATTGSVTNQGAITAQSAGLVALVAPAVSNQGSITATGGRIALSGADRATVSLTGGLYEFAVDAGALGTGASLANAAGARLEGATIFMSTGDAANLLSGVINLEGVQQASSAIVVNGDTVVLKSDLNAPAVSGSSNRIDVYSTASLQDAVGIAKTGAAGAGAAVAVHAGTYSEQVTLNKANLSLTGEAGAKVALPDLAEVNGITVAANNVTVQGLEMAGPLNSTPYYDYYATPQSNISRGIVVGRDVAGFTIRNNNIHDVRNGVLVNGINNSGSVAGNRIENTKSGISVQYTDAAGVAIADNTEGPIGNEWGLNLHLNGVWNPATGTINPNADPYIQNAPTLAWQQSLLDLSAANAGWKVQDQGYKSSNRTQVTIATTGLAGNQGSRLTPLDTIQNGMGAVVPGGVVNVNAGTYAENVSITKALTLKGAGAANSIIDPASGDAVTVSGAMGAGAIVLIDGFSFRDAPGAGVRVAGDTSLGQLTVQNGDFLNNGKYGFFVDGSSTAGVPGLANISLLNNTFEGNGAYYAAATSLGQGAINFNYYNGNATLRGLTITGDSEFVGIQMRGYHHASTEAVYDAGTRVFDNVTIGGSFRRPSDSFGGNNWNTSGPGDAIHLLEYGSVANVSFSNVVVNPAVGHGLFLEGLSSTLNIGNTRFGVPDGVITGDGLNPTRSYNIVSGSNVRNNVRTNVDATGAVFTGAAGGFDIEDRIVHALDVSGLGLVTWNAGNVYVTQASGSIQRALEAAGVGNSVNVAAAVYAENLVLNNPYKLHFSASTVHSLTLNAAADGTGIAGGVTADAAGGFLFNAPIILLGDTTLSTLGANITLNGHVQNADGVQYSLTLAAGAGSNRGDVRMTTGGSEGNPLNQFEVAASNFSLSDTLWVQRYRINALGNVALSSHTLRALDAAGTNTLTTGGNLTGATISKGSVEVLSSGDVSANVAAEGKTSVAANNISGNLSGTDVAVTAQGTVNVVVSATNSATLSGETVAGTISAPTAAVDSGGRVELALHTNAATVHAEGGVSLTGTASSIHVDAPSGSVSGDFGTVSNVGTGLFSVNGKPELNQTLTANAENKRVIPDGSALSDNMAPQVIWDIGLTRAVALSGSRGEPVRRRAPAGAGESIDQGQAVELDLSPGNEKERD